MNKPALTLALLLLAACGNKPAETAHGDATDASAAAPEPSSAASASSSSAPSADAGADPTPSGSASTAAKPPTTLPPPEPVDECTPVGVDLEKRARPKLRDCYKDAKKKDPNLEGTVKISVDVNTLGKVGTIKIAEKTLPDPVAQCMLKVVKTLPFPDAPKCAGKGITIPITFPTPH